MKPATKKISAIFFILLGFMPVLLVLSFEIKQQAIQNRMREKLEQHHLQKVVIPEKEVIWMDKHEIWVNGQMFDVHNFSLENGIYTINGLYDTEETWLVKQRNETNKTNNEENKLLSQLLKWLQSVYKNSNEQELNTLTGQPGNFQSFQASNFNHLFRKVPTPPPRACPYIC